MGWYVGRMTAPSASLIADYAPRTRWFLNTLLQMPPGDYPWVRFDSRLPEWDDEASPMTAIFERLQADGWIQKDEDEHLVATEAGRALTSEVAAAHAADLPEWWRRLWVGAAINAEIPVDGPLHRALMAVDRTACVREHDLPLAVLDMPLPLHKKMTESAPHAVAMTLAPLMPSAGERVLICGVKGGSLAVAAGHLVGKKGSVTALDWSPEVVEHARQAIAANQLNARVVVIEQEDVTAGLPSAGPYQVIIVNGAIPRVPYNLMHQLDDISGRILFFLHDGHQASECWVIRKNEAVLKEEKLSRFRYTPIPGRNGFDSIKDLQEQYEAARRAAENESADVGPIQTRAPYPLARAFIAAHNAIDPSERHDRALKVGEALLKYIAIIVISACFAADDRSPKVGVELRKLTGKPSNGQWLGSVRALGPIAANHPVGRLAVAELDRSWKHRALIDAYQALVEETGKPSVQPVQSVRLREMLDKLIEYRNKSGAGHGSVASPKQAQRVADLLLRALGTVLLESTLFQTHELHAIVKNEVKSRNKHIITVMRLQGASNLSERWELPPAVAAAWEPRVVLMVGQTPVLDLHPWFVWAEGSHRTPELFCYNNSRDDKYEYITYHNQDKFPDPSPTEDFVDLLGRFPEPTRPKVDPVQAQMMLSFLLGPIVADGKITVDELQTLRTAVLSFGIADSAETANQWVRDLIDREHPGVWFEE